MVNKIIAGYYPPKNLDSKTFFYKHNVFDSSPRFYKKNDILLESVKEITILFLADRHPKIRLIIKELDNVLKVGGLLKIIATDSIGHANGLRSLSQIKSEFSISTGGRYRLLAETGNNKVSLTYEKVESFQAENDSITNWSFGIITNGKNSNNVNNLISSINRQKIPNYEILICGPHYSDDPKVKVFDIEVDAKDIRAPITRKKNQIAENAIHENMIILHDRYLFPEDWYKKMIEYGNVYEMLVIPNIGQNGGRVNDWIAFYGLPGQSFSYGTSLLSYKENTESAYMQGGLMIIKRSIFNSMKLNENLYWGELEDVVFSKIAHLCGYYIYVDQNNKIYTNSLRLKEKKNLTFLPHIIQIALSKTFRPLYVLKNIVIHYINRIWMSY